MKQTKKNKQKHCDLRKLRMSNGLNVVKQSKMRRIWKSASRERERANANFLHEHKLQTVANELKKTACCWRFYNFPCYFAQPKRRSPVQAPQNSLNMSHQAEQTRCTTARTESQIQREREMSARALILPLHMHSLSSQFHWKLCIFATAFFFSSLNSSFPTFRTLCLPHAHFVLKCAVVNKIIVSFVKWAFFSHFDSPMQQQQQGKKEIYEQEWNKINWNI